MSEEEKTRTDEVQEYKDDIEEIINEAAKVKELAQSNIEENRDICVNMDRVEDSLGKQKEIAETLTKDVVDTIAEPDWDNMRNQFGQASNTRRTVLSLRRDMESTKTQMSGFTTVTSTFASSTASSGWSGYEILGTYADKYPPVKRVLEKVEFHPTWIKDIDFIKQELPRIMPNVVKEFESVIADMSGTWDPDLKHKALLSLRSVIFYQLFDTLAEEPLYCQTPWYKLTPPSGTPFRKKRFCQAKFFIIGMRDESQFSQSMMDTINKTAMELQNRFDQMSNYGKEGASSTLVDNCYRETLASFANALRLKSEVQKNYP
jgi:regulator of replication initiation timing